MKKTIQIHEYELPITVKREKDGHFIATCNSWKDCYAQGDSAEQVVSEISNVATSLIQLYNEEDLSIPLKQVTKSQKSKSSFKLNFPLIVSTS